MPVTALQTGGPSPNLVDVLRLPNRVFEDPAVYVHRKAVSVVRQQTTRIYLSDQSSILLISVSRVATIMSNHNRTHSTSKQSPITTNAHHLLQ
jgi:hypothetical protein